ncbi:MAG TPA: TIGR02301 family protein, partial [Alphaproteobacteria bacterium]|nr:TIGR02301 family protein [Alphaproteobacteria bacterium]
AVRRAKLVNKFNDGYRGYRRTYRTCTQSATLATRRFSTEGAQIAASLAQTSIYASGPQVHIPAPQEADAGTPDETGATPGAPAGPNASN